MASSFHCKPVANSYSKTARAERHASPASNLPVRISGPRVSIRTLTLACTCCLIEKARQVPKCILTFSDTSHYVDTLSVLVFRLISLLPFQGVEIRGTAILPGYPSFQGERSMCSPLVGAGRLWTSSAASSFVLHDLRGTCCNLGQHKPPGHQAHLGSIWIPISQDLWRNFHDFAANFWTSE